MEPAIQLEYVIGFKIAITTVFWCLPLLLGPAWLFERLGVPVPAPMVFARLLGAAYAALLVVYVYGLAAARVEEPSDASMAVAELSALVGIVSNGLAAFVLAVFGVRRAWSDWGRMGRWYMWASLVLTSAITVGLLQTGTELFR